MKRFQGNRKLPKCHWMSDISEEQVCAVSHSACSAKWSVRTNVSQSRWIGIKVAAPCWSLSKLSSLRIAFRSGNKQEFQITQKLFRNLHVPWLFGSGSFSRGTKCITVVLPRAKFNATRKKMILSSKYYKQQNNSSYHQAWRCRAEIDLGISNAEYLSLGTFLRPSLHRTKAKHHKMR